jgi:hypothetical protein
MRDDGTHEAVSPPAAARGGVELPGERLRGTGPGWKGPPACGDPARLGEVEGGFRAGDPRERVVGVGARR